MLDNLSGREINTELTEILTVDGDIKVNNVRELINACVPSNNLLQLKQQPIRISALS